MTFLYFFTIALFMILCLLLCVVILMQESKSSGLGASFGSTVILSLYWKRTTRYGIMAGMITGAVVIIIWYYFLEKITGLYELIPAFLCSMITIIVVSLLTRKSTSDKEQSD